MMRAALLDANIIYPAPMRDLFLQLAVTDIFKARWTERTRDLMNSKTRDCLVTGYEAFIPMIELPDPDDRHVVAAAIVGRCDFIVTQNLKDFPEAVRANYGIAVQHPDEFLCQHLELEQDLFCSAVKKVRERLKTRLSRSNSI